MTSGNAPRKPIVHPPSPVNESLRTSLELHSTSPIAAAFLADEGMTESTPGGTPARCASSHRARAEYGVRSEGLTTCDVKMGGEAHMNGGEYSVNTCS